MATFFTSCEDDDPDPQQPTITAINPSSGAVGQQVTITGTNFGSSPTVTFGSTNATVTNASNTSITTTVPAGLSVGAVQVTVTASGMTSSASTFTVTEEAVEGPAELYITDEDLADGEYNWVNDTTYFLTGLVYLEEGGVLNIEEGTTIRFTADAGDDNTSALIITSGAQIFAEGTADDPIIFTSEADTTGAELLPGGQGLWGGLILLGNAPAEKDGATSGINIDGIDSSEPRGSYGGTVADDNSGVLQYVSIRYTGVGIASGSEIQGLTLAGVGSGTTIDHVDIYASNDDGIEIFGGTVNISHISVAFATDDAFDFDLGWRGNAQFLFSLQLEGEYDQAGEWDGADPDDAALFSAPNVFNATFIGPGQNATGAERAILMREGFAGKLGNSIIEDFPGIGLQVQDREGDVDSYARLITPVDGYQLEILNNTWAQFGEATDIASLIEATVEESGFNGETEAVEDELTTNDNIYSADPIVTSISRENDGGLDPRPAAATAATATVPSGLEQAEYRGAFEPGQPTWLSGWSTLSQIGILVD